MATWDGVPSLLATHPSKTLGDTAIEDVFQPGDTAIEDGSRTLATQLSKMVLGVGNLGDTPIDTYMGGCCTGIPVETVEPVDPLAVRTDDGPRAWEPLDPCTRGSFHERFGPFGPWDPRGSGRFGPRWGTWE